MFLLITYAAIALGVSFLCSMLEASLLSLPASHVAMLVERGSRFGRRCLREGTGDRQAQQEYRDPADRTETGSRARG